MIYTAFCSAQYPISPTRLREDPLETSAGNFFPLMWIKATEGNMIEGRICKIMIID